MSQEQAQAQTKTKMDSKMYWALRRMTCWNTWQISTSKTTISPKRWYLVFKSTTLLKSQKLKKIGAEENLKKSNSTSWQTWKLWYTKYWLIRNTYNCWMVWETNKKTNPEECSPAFNEITERIGLVFAGDNIVTPEELKWQVVEALHFGHPGSTKMVTECNFCWWSGIRKDIEN